MKGFTYLDEYDFRAQFVPSIITTLPIITAIIALFPPARQLYGLLIGPALEVVLVLMVVRVARDEGKRIEPRLIKQRDGLPTTNSANFTPWMPSSDGLRYRGAAAARFLSHQKFERSYVSKNGRCPRPCKVSGCNRTPEGRGTPGGRA
jgi:hypothetical protein